MRTPKPAAVTVGVLAAMLFTVLLLMVGADPARASSLPEAYPPSAVGLQLSTNVICPGSSFTVTGQGFAPTSHVTITLMSTPVLLATATTNSSGSFSQLVTIPVGTPLGPHEIVASGPSFANPAQTLTLSAAINFQCPAAPAAIAPKPGLAFTGSDTRIWLAASLAFVLVGSALVLGARKRRHRHAS